MHVAADCRAAAQVHACSVEQLLPLCEGAPGTTWTHGHDLKGKQTWGVGVFGGGVAVEG